MLKSILNVVTDLIPVVGSIKSNLEKGQITADELKELTK